MNDRALLRAGSDVNSAAPLPRAWFASEDAEDFEAEISEYVRAKLDEAPLTLIKDPRLSPLARCWRSGIERLGIEPRVIIALRDPWEVAQSLSSRQLRHFPDEIWPKERVTAIWLNYLLAIEEATRGCPRTFIDYSWLLANWRTEVERMAEQLDLQLEPSPGRKTLEVEAFLLPEARRARRDVTERDDDLLTAAYRVLKDRRDDPQGGREAFDALRSQVDTAFRVLGGYVVGLEGRAGDITEARAALKRAEAEVVASQEVAEAAELRALHLRRQPQVSQSGPTGSVSSEAGEAELLRARLTALTAAHREVAEEVKRDRRAWARERTELQDKIAGARRAEERAELGRLASVERNEESARRRAEAAREREWQGLELGAEWRRKEVEAAELHRREMEAVTVRCQEDMVEAAELHRRGMEAVTVRCQEDMVEAADLHRREMEAVTVRCQEDMVEAAELHRRETEATSARCQEKLNTLADRHRSEATARRRAERSLESLRRSLALALGHDPGSEVITGRLLTGSVRILMKTYKHQTEVLAGLRKEQQAHSRELDLSRDAYEAVRLEAAGLRTRAITAESQSAAFAHTLQQEVAVFSSAARALHGRSAEYEATIRCQSAVLDSTRAELTNLYGSRSWRAIIMLRRLASPRRSFSRLLRRAFSFAQQVAARLRAS